MPKLCPVCGATFSDANIFCPRDGSTLRAAELDSDLIGTVVADRYLVTDLLGEGGMGKVYLARHVRLPQQAAIKVLRPAMLRDPAAVARFNREAANASSIEHEHIARVFDYGESSDGTVYLAMEYVPGRTLKKILLTDGPMSPERTAGITRQIGHALDAAHKLGIVHRDLKPDNVMVVESEDSGDRCKVVDFGIAKAVGGDAGEAGLTKTGFVVGTPEFMSPEQLLGSVIDHRSDVYALALLSFQCLTGALPFDTSTPERAMTAKLIDTPKPLSAVKSDSLWPPALQAVFDRGLAREAQQRQASAGLFARELQQAIADWGKDTTVAPRALPSAHEVLSARGSSQGAPGAVATTAPNARPGSEAATAPMAAASRTADAVPERQAAGETASSRSRMIMLAAGAAATIGIVALILTKSGGVNGTDGSGSSASEPSSVIALTPPLAPQGEAAPSSVAPMQGTEGGEQPATSGDNKPAASPPASQPEPSPAGTSTRTPVPPTKPNASPRAEPNTTTDAVAAARFTLDSLRIALNPATATETDARRGVAALRALMPRLVTAEDSAWNYLRQAEAHFIMVDELSACVALKAATPLIRDAAQQRILTSFSGVLTVRC